MSAVLYKDTRVVLQNDEKTIGYQLSRTMAEWFNLSGCISKQNHAGDVKNT